MAPISPAMDAWMVDLATIHNRSIQQSAKWTRWRRSSAGGREGKKGHISAYYLRTRGPLEQKTRTNRKRRALHAADNPPLLFFFLHRAAYILEGIPARPQEVICDSPENSRQSLTNAHLGGSKLHWLRSQTRGLTIARLTPHLITQPMTDTMSQCFDS